MSYESIGDHGAVPGRLRAASGGHRAGARRGLHRDPTGVTAWDLRRGRGAAAAGSPVRAGCTGGAGASDRRDPGEVDGDAATERHLRVPARTGPGRRREASGRRSTRMRRRPDPRGACPAGVTGRRGLPPRAAGATGATARAGPTRPSVPRPFRGPRGPGGRGAGEVSPARSRPAPLTRGRRSPGRFRSGRRRGGSAAPSAPARGGRVPPDPAGPACRRRRTGPGEAGGVRPESCGGAVPSGCRGPAGPTEGGVGRRTPRRGGRPPAAPHTNRGARSVCVDRCRVCRCPGASLPRCSAHVPEHLRRGPSAVARARVHT